MTGMFHKTKFESVNNTANTPDSILIPLKKEFKFDRDLAADEENKICTKYYSIKDNTLNQDFHGIGYILIRHLG